MVCCVCWCSYILTSLIQMFFFSWTMFLTTIFLPAWNIHTYHRIHFFCQAPISLSISVLSRTVIMYKHHWSSYILTLLIQMFFTPQLNHPQYFFQEHDIFALLFMCCSSIMVKEYIYCCSIKIKLNYMFTGSVVFGMEESLGPQL